MNYKEWSKFDLNYLHTNYNKVKPQTIANKLGRSIRSIVAKAYAEGLCTKRPKD